MCGAEKCQFFTGWIPGFPGEISHPISMVGVQPEVPFCQQLINFHRLGGKKLGMGFHYKICFCCFKQSKMAGFSDQTYCIINVIYIYNA